MKHLVSFYIKRKFKEPVTIILNIIVCLVIIGLCNFDLIFNINNYDLKVIKLDSSTSYLFPYLEESENYYYCVSDYANDENEAILHYDGKYTLITDCDLKQEELNLIQLDLKQALKTKYHKELDEKTKYYLDLIDNEIEMIVQQQENNDFVWIVASIIYFLIITYGSLISNDIVFEKNSRILELQFTCIDAKEHFKAKFATGYLSLLIQLGIVLLALIIGISIRYRIDEFSGLMKMVQESDYSFNINWINIMFVVGIVSIGIVSIQIVLLVLCSRCTNGEQSSTINSLFYILSLIIYYYILTNNSIDIFITYDYLSYIPFINIYFCSLRLIAGLSTYMEGLTSIIISVFFLYILIEVSLPLYRRNLIKK